MGAGPVDLSCGALEVLANGGEVNYEGASTTLDWDEYGDLLRGHAGVRRFTEEGNTEVVKCCTVRLLKPEPRVTIPRT